MQQVKISEGKIKEYALQATLLIGAYSLILGIVFYFLFGAIFRLSSDPLPLLAFASFGLGLWIACYTLLRKMFSGLAYDASKKGIDDDIRRKHDRAY